MFFKNSFTFYALILIFTLIGNLSFTQPKTFETHTIAFYNVENLFDTINDLKTLDQYSPIHEIKERRTAVYKQKIKHISKVISRIGFEYTGNSPAIIGVSEVENKTVLEDLVSDSLLVPKAYNIIHFNSPDIRGIDVALLYQKALFRPLTYTSESLSLTDKHTNKPLLTRDVLVVSGFLNKTLIHILVVHWPSRRGGKQASAYKRIAVAKLCRRIVDSIEAAQPNSKLIIMGDFNDNPTNKSIKHFLKTKATRSQLKQGDLYNPMEALYKKGIGSNAYRDKWSLFNQIIVSKALINPKYSTFGLYKAHVFNKSFLITKTGRYKGYPFRSFSYKGFTGGYSDHFPVYIQLLKAM